MNELYCRRHASSRGSCTARRDGGGRWLGEDGGRNVIVVKVIRLAMHDRGLRVATSTVVATGARWDIEWRRHGSLHIDGVE
jgi:hypothetical protein